MQEIVVLREKTIFFKFMLENFLLEKCYLVLCSSSLFLHCSFGILTNSDVIHVILHRILCFYLLLLLDVIPNPFKSVFFLIEFFVFSFFEIDGLGHIADRITKNINIHNIKRLVQADKIFSSYFQNPTTWIRRWKYFGLSDASSNKWQIFVNSIQDSTVIRILIKMFFYFEIEEHNMQFSSADPAFIIVKVVNKVRKQSEDISWADCQRMFDFLSFQEINKCFKLHELVIDGNDHELVMDSNENTQMVFNYIIELNKCTKVLFKAPSKVESNNIEKKGFLILYALILGPNNRRIEYKRETFAYALSQKMKLQIDHH